MAGATAQTPTVHLVRHAQTAWNAQGRFLGATDLPLDEVGHAQAAALAASWQPRPEIIVCSPLLRARQTAAALGPFEVDDDLRELDQGALEGRTVADAMASYPAFFAAWAADPGAVDVPGGEGLAAAQARAVAAILRAVDRWPGRSIIVVSHQLVLAAAQAAFAAAPLRGWRRFSLAHAGRVTVARTPGGWSLDAPGHPHTSHTD